MKYRLITVILTFIITLVVLFACDSSPTDTGDANIDQPPNGNGDAPFSHTAGPGQSFGEFLLDDRFTELLVEVQFMPGFEPEPESLEELESFLHEHTGKTITLLEPEEIPSGEQESYTATDIRDLEEEHRNHYSEGSALASYSLFVDGQFEQENVLGIAYSNTSTAYFGETIHNNSGSGITQPSRVKIEATVLRHEYGHLFGLVGSDLDMEEDHQENGPHCSEDECVMYHTVNTTDFLSNLLGEPIPDLDDFCLADIAAFQQN